MKVWVVFCGDPYYDGAGRIVSIHATKEGAEAAKPADKWAAEYSIEEWTVEQ